jgi:hypothetical protein
VDYSENKRVLLDELAQKLAEFRSTGSGNRGEEQRC